MVTAVLGVAFILVCTTTSCDTNYYSVGPDNVVCAECIARFTVYGNSTPTLHTHHNTTHISVAGSHLDVMLTGGPAMFPGVHGGCPSPPSPPPPCCCCPLAVVEAPRVSGGYGNTERPPSRTGRQESGWKRRRSPVVIILGCSNSTIFHSEYLTFLHKHSTHTYECHRNKVCSSPAWVRIGWKNHNMYCQWCRGRQGEREGEQHKGEGSYV